MLSAAAVLALAPVAEAQAGPPTADVTTYLNDMHSAGIFSDDGDSDLVSGGWAICRELSAGASRQEVAAEITDASHKYHGADGVTPNDADKAVLYANHDLCPGF